jgi:subtilisin family serine protease
MIQMKRWIAVGLILIAGISAPACVPNRGDDDSLLWLLLLLAASNQANCGNPNRKSALMTSGDPLIGEMWHLNNVGQRAFASGSATACQDINVADAIVSGLTGAGVIAVVVDSGLEIAHEDLAQNVLPGGSFDFVGADDDPTSTDVGGDHGTSVGGLIGARGFNGVGVRGVAPAVSLQGWNFIQAQSAANQVLSLGGAGGATNGFIYNMSYGTAALTPLVVDATLEAHLNGPGRTTLRGGRGGIFIKSAGNGFSDIQGLGECNAANFIGVSCQNANNDPTNTAVEVIVVGSLNARGIKASYSTAGSALLVSAPGGEFGFDFGTAPGFSSIAYEPALLTVDQMGCNRGFARTSLNPLPSLFMNNANGRNPGCDYTSTFNGTSSAAPVVSGVIALMLEANPNLSWRDVQRILATTARQVDVNRAAVVDTGVAGNYVSEPAWTTNAAGRPFHNWYGFGAVDADAAVAAARAYTDFLFAGGILSDTNNVTGLNLAVPDNNATGVTNSLGIASNFTIETVQVEVSTTSSNNTFQDIALELVSPSGTKSVMLNNKNGLGAAGSMTNTRFRSNAFLDEPSVGNWTLRVVDGFADAPTYTLTAWRVRVFGH